MKTQYPLQVGILLEQPVIRFAFRAAYSCTNGNSYNGEQSAMCHNGKILFDGNAEENVNEL